MNKTKVTPQSQTKPKFRGKKEHTCLHKKDIMTRERETNFTRDEKCDVVPTGTDFH